MARFEGWPPEPLCDSSIYAELMFGDGSQKGLAAFVVWLSIILVWRNHDADSLQDPLVQGLICSLIRIPTSVRASEVKGSHMEATIGRIVAQNVNSKVQPITSFGWAGILRELVGENASFDDCMAAYNRHPEVMAHDREDTGTGSISLDSRKRTAVRNFLDRCDPAAFDIICQSNDDLPFSIGAFGESFACTNSNFLGSKVPLEAITATDEVSSPMAGEAFVEASWQRYFWRFFACFPIEMIVSF